MSRHPGSPYAGRNSNRPYVDAWQEFRSGAGLSASKKKRDLSLPGDYAKIVLPVEFHTKVI